MKSLEFIQASAFEHTPIPLLVSDRNRIVLAANRAAKELLGRTLSNSSKNIELRGLCLEDFAIFKSEKKDDTPNWSGHEEIIIEQLEWSGGKTNVYATLISSATDEFQNVITFTNVRECTPPVYPPPKPSIDTTCTTESIGGLPIPEPLSRIRNSLFSSIKKPAFFMTADERYYLPNKSLRTLLGEDASESIGYDAQKFLDAFHAWDVDFQDHLDLKQFPATRLTRGRKNFDSQWCGFINPWEKAKFVLEVKGECIYDPKTMEFLGGVCWCADLMSKSDYDIMSLDRHLLSFETLASIIPHLVWTCDREGNCIYFNKRWYDFTGLTSEESLGLGYRKAMHPDDLPILLSRWDVAFREGRTCEAEVRYQRHDGTYRWMLSRAQPYKDSDGNILKWYGTTTDIDDIVKARIHARKIQQQMVTILAHAELHLFATDDQGIFTFSDGRLKWDADVYDSSDKSSIRQRSIYQILDETEPGGLPSLRSSVRTILDGNATVMESIDMVKGRIYKTILVADIAPDDERISQNQPLLGLTLDITEASSRATLLMENAKLQKEQEAAIASNVQKSQFLANMSHEIRTPISGCIGLTEHLLSTNLTEEQQEYVENIQLSSNALLAIVNDILDFSKIESGRFDINEVPFNLSDAVNDLYKLLSFSTKNKNFKFELFNELSNLDMLIGDSGRLKQILSNLLTNSLKFTSLGFVRFTAKSFTQRDIEYATFVVEDTGIGISNSAMSKLFQPFQQGDASTARIYGGTGLGLSISKKLVELMKGEIHMTSTLGVGTMAEVTLPFRIAKNEKIEKSEDKIKNTISIKRDEIKVLLVEDNPILHKVTLKSIKNLGFHVSGVWNGKEAVDYLQTEEILPKIVLMDVQMPLMDGYTATKALRIEKRFEHIPIVALTASAIVGDQAKCLKAGMDDYLMKPVSPNDLEETLIKWTLNSRSI